MRLFRDKFAIPCLLIQFFFTVMVFIVAELVNLSHLESFEHFFSMALVANFSFLAGMFIIIAHNGRLVCIPVFFSIFMYIFSGGILILTSLGIFGPRDHNPWDSIELCYLSDAAEFVAKAFCFFVMGMVARHNRKKGPIFLSYNHAAKKTGLILIAIGFIPWLAETINNVQLVVFQGYSAWYDLSNRVAFLGFLTYYFIVGLIFLALSGGKKVKNKYLAVLIAVVTIRFACGDRGEAMMLLFAAYYIYLSDNVSTFAYFKSYKKRIVQSIILIIIGIIAVLCVPIIKRWRYDAWTGAGFLEVAANALSLYNPFILAFETVGGTLGPLAWAIKIFPQEINFTYGLTYLVSLVTIPPSSILFGFLNDLYKNHFYSSPANWMMEYLNLNYGPGFTPFAEAYMNFGQFGIYFMFIFGLFFNWIFNIEVKSDRRISIVLSIISFWLVGFTARSSFNYNSAYLVRYVLIPYILYRLIKTHYVRRGETC